VTSEWLAGYSQQDLREVVMRFRQVMLGACAFALLGCSDTVAPSADLSGTWLASHVESSVTLVLQQSGSTITGSGTYWRFVNPPSGTLTVTGTYARPEVTLTFRYDDGRVSQYAGRVRGDSDIVGAETFSAGGTDSLAFVRQ
jgi:hypothetical protein